MAAPVITLIGGPTALIEAGGFRFLTDPTFDGPGEYKLPHVTLTKTSKPALTLDQIGTVDAVLLSHDQHADNLDNRGREALTKAQRVFTTAVGAKRLANHAEGLGPWQTVRLSKPDGRSVLITATPARHGPAGIEPLSGDVIGFVVERKGGRPVYISGDTVWFDGVAEVARRLDVRVAVLNLGAARVAAAGPQPLTFAAEEAVQVARAMPQAAIVPLHFEGWEHFSESRADVERAFAAAALERRLRWPLPGEPITL